MGRNRSIARRRGRGPRPWRLQVACLPWLACLGPLPAAAAEAGADLAEWSIEELARIELPRVSAATRNEQRSDQAPASVTVIDAEQIRRFGWRTLSEVLSTVRGFYMATDRVYDRLGTRGFGRPGDLNTRVLVQIDGHRLNDWSYGQGSIDGVLPIDLDLVDRIEIVRGPGSALYGTSAFFAVINVIPKSAGTIGGGETALGAGSGRAASARLTGAHRFASGLEVSGSATEWRSDGDRRYALEGVVGDPMAPDGVVRDADGEHRRSAYLSLRDGATWLTAVSGSRSKTLGSGLYGTLVGDARNRFVDGHDYLDFGTSRLLGEQGTLHARLSYHEHRLRSTLAHRGPTGSPLERVAVFEGEESTDNRWWSTELRYVTRLGAAQRLTLGLEQVEIIRNRQASRVVGMPQPLLDIDSRDRTLGLYAQDEVSLGERLTATLGLRRDWLGAGRSSGSPRLALVWLPNEATALKALHGRAFRAPGAYERFYAIPGVALPNPDLAPERIATTELVGERSLGRGLRLTASLYRYEIDGLITQVPGAGGLPQYRNVDRVEGRGAELELRALVGRAQLHAGLTVQRATDQTRGEPLSNSPRRTAQLGLLAPLPDSQWTLAWTMVFLSGRVGDSASGMQPSVGAATVHHLNLLAPRILRGVDLSVGVYNVGGHRALAPVSLTDDARLVGVPQPGRSLRAKLVWRF